MPELDKLVTVTLDKDRHLRLSLKGMIEFEKLTGRNLLKGFTIKDLTLEDSAALVFACLIHEDKELTFDDVLCMIDISNLKTVMDAVSKCLEQGFPVARTGERPLVEKSLPG